MVMQNYRNVNEQDIWFFVLVGKKGRALPKSEIWPDCDNTVTNPELSEGLVPIQDKYCIKSESKYCI